ncbi:hypothetical protein Tco_0253955, partial [Tanacetum coccineum]
TALSTTFASASTVPSVSVDDYIIVDEENEENVQLDVEEEKQGKGEGSAVLLDLVIMFFYFGWVCHGASASWLSL